MNSEPNRKRPAKQNGLWTFEEGLALEVKLEKEAWAYLRGWRVWAPFKHRRDKLGFVFPKGHLGC